MATDLTIKFQENFSATVETGLSKDITINNVFKSSEQLLNQKSFLTVDTSFDYGDNKLSIRYIIDLPIASLIFHSMMFEEFSLEEELNEDLKDACKEFISQISGALETSINGEAYEDINNVKFTVGDMASFKETTYSPLGQLYRYDLTIDNNSFDLYIDMTETSMEFFEELSNAPDDPQEVESPLEEIEEIQEELEEVNEESEEEISMIPDELADALEEHTEEVEPETQIENEVELPNEENEAPQVENTQEETSDETTTDSKENEEDGEKELSEEEMEQKRKKKMKLLIIILGGLILVLVITILAMFFMGVFDEPEEMMDNNETKKKPTKQELIIAEIKNKHIDFTPEMMNHNRLNKKLALLTKYEILEEDIVAKFQEDEKERLYKLKMQRLEEFAKNNKEESLFKSTLNKDSNMSSRFDNNVTSNIMVVDEKYLNEKLTFIKVDPIEYKNFKEIITKEKTSSTLVSMCKDKSGKVNIYIGPMFLTLETNNIIKKVRKTYPEKTSSISIDQMIRKDFNSICNF